MTVRTGLLILLVIVAVVVGVLIAPLVHVSVGSTTGGSVGTTGGDPPVTTVPTQQPVNTGGSGTTKVNPVVSTGTLSWTELEAKINLSPSVSTPQQPYNNVYHVGDDGQTYTASCYGHVRFELTASDGSQQVIDCSSNPTIPSFKGATIYNDGKDVCQIYRDHLNNYGPAQLIGATC